MLIRFIVSNFLSFDEEVEFNMLSGSFKTQPHHVYQKGNLKLLKAAAIYGANGAGKSNLIKAVSFLQEMVKTGKLNQNINQKKFKLHSQNREKPTTFEIEFVCNKKNYSYGVSVNSNYIVEEWLYETSPTREAKLIFERKRVEDGTSKIEVALKYRKTAKDKLLIQLMEENLLQGNELFLGKTEALKIDLLTNIRKHLINTIVVIYPDSKPAGLFIKFCLDKAFRDFTNELFQTFGTGVDKLIIDSTPIDDFFGENDIEQKEEVMNALETNLAVSTKDERGEEIIFAKQKEGIFAQRLMTGHKNQDDADIRFEVSEESDGTNRILDFMPAIYAIIHTDRTVLIDEIDQSLHPSLLHTIISKIMAEKTTKGQLIFTTHESNLLNLNIFRQDEIWFVEKDKQTKATKFYSLSEFKPRHDLNIKKGYLKGRFGAIPFMADLEQLNWTTDGVQA